MKLDFISMNLRLGRCSTDDYLIFSKPMFSRAVASRAASLHQHYRGFRARNLSMKHCSDSCPVATDTPLCTSAGWLLAVCMWAHDWDTAPLAGTAFRQTSQAPRNACPAETWHPSFHVPLSMTYYTMHAFCRWFASTGPCFQHQAPFCGIWQTIYAHALLVFYLKYAHCSCQTHKWIW